MALKKRSEFIVSCDYGDCLETTDNIAHDFAVPPEWMRLEVTERTGVVRPIDDLYFCPDHADRVLQLVHEYGGEK